MKKKIWMMLLCGALVCFPLGGCGINRADADTGSVQSEAASDHKTTKNSNTEYTSEVFAMDTYMTLTAYGENAKEAVEAGKISWLRYENYMQLYQELKEQKKY